jgi:hypothetical protein
MSSEGCRHQRVGHPPQVPVLLPPQRIGGYDTIGLIVLFIAAAVIFIAGKVQEHYQKKDPPARADRLLPGRRV